MKNMLESFSARELQEELERREAEKIDTPAQLFLINDTSLREQLDEYMAEMISGVEDTDTEHYLIEELVKTYYGQDIYNHINV